jgi:hypothetical protein
MRVSRQVHFWQLCVMLGRDVERVELRHGYDPEGNPIGEAEGRFVVIGHDREDLREMLRHVEGAQLAYETLAIEEDFTAEKQGGLPYEYLGPAAGQNLTLTTNPDGSPPAGTSESQPKET